ncbi:hypothetical protein [uncultured Thiothrix sp.]|uniref:hypothetical protein n=1 Tax=uncultured Thiothrix sp. TaxID=223185 RepID=UPI00260659B0|nr:hypothetical protein [uncultured Thiothrix sp.]
MELSLKELQILKDLDDGSLYASPMLVQQLLRYPGMRNPRLFLSFDYHGKADGYLPVGQCYNNDTYTYIAAMPNSPAISPTYTPGALQVLKRLRLPYFDTDVVSYDPQVKQEPTASAYGLPLEKYLQLLSPSRRTDIRRKLKKLASFSIVPGKLINIVEARPWLLQVWAERFTAAELKDQDAYAHVTLAWLAAVQHSGRAILKIDRYQWQGKMVGINCCVLHHYRGRLHCDDYLTWYDPKLASGLGIISVVRNLTDPYLLGSRYNLGSPGVGGTHPRHVYKLNLLPPSLRLTQSVFDTRQYYRIKQAATL